MAKFRLKEGETVIQRAQAKDPNTRWTEHSELILTDLRIVVTRKKQSGLGMLFGVLGALLGEAFSETRLEYQIARGELAKAEATGPKELSVVSTGDGYLVTRFGLKLKDAPGWADRLHRWSAGAPDANLPRATVVTD